MTGDGNTQTDVNDTATRAQTRQNLTQKRSRPVRLQLIGPDGKKYGKYTDKEVLGEEAERLWPGLAEGEAPDGWSVQVPGFKAPKIRRSRNR